LTVKKGSSIEDSFFCLLN